MQQAELTIISALTSPCCVLAPSRLRKVVIPSVVGMGTLKKSKKTGKADDSGEDAEEDGEGTLTTSNGDSSFRSVEGKDTLFLKELRVKAEVRPVVFSIVVL